MASRKQRSKRSKYRLRTIVPALAALLLFFLPMLALIPFWLFVEGFIPSIELRPAAELSAVFTGATFLALLWRPQIHEIKGNWAASHRRRAIEATALLVFTPFFGAAIGHGFVHGPLSYVLHNINASGLEKVMEHVIRADDFGGRSCRHRALLENDGLLWQRQLCGISAEAVTRLQRGGHVYLEGSVSRYGIHVKRYALVIVNPSIERTTSDWLREPPLAADVER